MRPLPLRPPSRLLYILPILVGAVLVVNALPLVPLFAGDQAPAGASPASELGASTLDPWLADELEAAPGTAAATSTGPPNVLLIVTDDQRYDTMGYMPRTQALIFDQGASFERAYVTTPLCCPSRASILTGQYAHNHGVLLNPYPLRQETFVHAFHDAGYNTALVGKFLNSWDGSPRPEFDHWVAFTDGPGRYFDPQLNVNGNWTQTEGYLTHLLRDHALAWLDEALDDDAPFLLLYTPYAPHHEGYPAPGDEELYPDLALHRPPSYNEADTSDKPHAIQRLPPIVGQAQYELDALRLRQIQSLHALDLSIEQLLTMLDVRGALDNTVVVFLSDNGVFWGEHRLVEKIRVYEEAVHVPMAIRYPPLVAGPVVVRDHLVANIDVAPTLYELAGVAPPGYKPDGLSLVGLLDGSDPVVAWRDALLIEGWFKRQPLYTAVHTGDWVFIENAGDRAEMYDLVFDPYQLDNLADDPGYGPVRAVLEGRLAELRPARVNSTI